jgi:hypothetical protein
MALAEKEARYNPSKIITEHKYDDVDFSSTKYGAAEARGKWYAR